jgi:AcrR family transcriptional regulator
MNRRERKKEETRSNIIDCAIDLFKEKGYPETSMEEIGEKSDVSKGTLYNYFPDKGAILIAYFQSRIADYGQEIKTSLEVHQPIKVRLGNLLDFKNQIFGNDMELTANYFRYRMQTLLNDNPFDNPQRSGLENIVLEIITEAQDKREIRSDIPALTIARNFLLFTAIHFISSINTREPAENDHFKEQLLTLFLDGARA